MKLVLDTFMAYLTIIKTFIHSNTVLYQVTCRQIISNTNINAVKNFTNQSSYHLDQLKHMTIGN